MACERLFRRSATRSSPAFHASVGVVTSAGCQTRVSRPGIRLLFSCSLVRPADQVQNGRHRNADKVPTFMFAGRTCDRIRHVNGCLSEIRITGDLNHEKHMPLFHTPVPVDRSFAHFPLLPSFCFIPQSKKSSQRKEISSPLFLPAPVFPAGLCVHEPATGDQNREGNANDDGLHARKWAKYWTSGT